MEMHSPVARAAVTSDSDWEPALRRVLNETRGAKPDAVFLFVSAQLADAIPAIVERAWQETKARVLIGCSGIGVIGPDRELERVPAISVLQITLPDGDLTSVRLTQSLVESASQPEAWHTTTGITPEQVNGWLVFADPFHLDPDALIAGMTEAYPGVPIVGGMASPNPMERRTWVFLDGQVHQDGGVALAIGGQYTLVPLVSQGCEPIGETWTITGVQDNWIETISNRPAIDVMIETLHGLPDYLHVRAQQNVLIGLAADEYRHDFRRGDFLVRNIVGIDRNNGAIAIGALPRIGQTMQFQMRDAATADLDLTVLLDDLRTSLGGQRPIAGILCTCNGRGVNLFGASHHDANAISKKLGVMPLAGLFCAGEIGPIGGKTHLHGFTASLGLIVEKL